VLAAIPIYAASTLSNRSKVCWISRTTSFLRALISGSGLSTESNFNNSPITVSLSRLCWSLFLSSSSGGSAMNSSISGSSLFSTSCCTDSMISEAVRGFLCSGFGEGWGDGCFCDLNEAELPLCDGAEGGGALLPIHNIFAPCSMPRSWRVAWSSFKGSPAQIKVRRL